MKSIKFLLPFAALALSGFAAANPRDGSSVVVRYGDLNLNSRDGVVRLHKRIRNAAESVCGNLDSRIFELQYAYRKCIDEAVARAVAAVDNSNLSSFHADRGAVLAATR